MEKLSTFVNSLSKARDKMANEWRSRLEASVRGSTLAESKVADKVEATEQKIIGVLEQVRGKLAEQDRCLSRLAEVGLPPLSCPTSTL